jgi:hypothetical protein
MLPGDFGRNRVTALETEHFRFKRSSQTLETMAATFRAVTQPWNSRRAGGRL